MIDTDCGRKTQIALDFAYQRREDPTCSIFWICAIGRTTFLRDFKKISISLGLNIDLEGEKLLKAVCESIQSEPKWLLVIDGADDLASLGGNPGSDTTKNRTNLLDYVPSSSTGTTLWTSCDRDVLGMVRSPNEAIHVHQMACNEALKLFEITRNQNISETEKASTRTLIDELGRHPLAILQAGIYSQLTSAAVNQYLLELDGVNLDQRIDIFNESDFQSEADVPRRIIKAVNLSIKYIQERNWIACNVLYVLSNLSNKEISLSIIRAVTWSCIKKDGRHPNTLEQEMEAAVALLRKYSFLYMATEQSGELNFEMPKIIQEVAQVTSSSGNRMTKANIAIRPKLFLQTVLIGVDGSGERGDIADDITNVYFLRMALETMEYRLTKRTQEMDMQYEKYLNHILRLCNLAESREEIEMAVKLLNILSSNFSRNGLWDNMAVVALRALELRVDALGKEHADTLWSMGNLASSFYQQGLYGEARQFLENLLKLRRNILGPDHFHTMWTMSSLGVTYGMQGQYCKAEEIFRSLISLQRDTVGERHPETIMSMRNLAATSHSQGNYDDAEEVLRSVLALTITDSQHKYPEIRQVNHMLSVVQQSRASAAKAE